MAIEAEKQKMKLYSNWMSSCSRRVRLALNLKGLEYDCINIASVGDPDLLKVNPMGYVPALVDDTTVVSDSYAILLYLEEKYPLHPLLPQDLTRKAINYQVASIVSSSIQPLQNMTLINYIGEIVGPDEKIPWAQYHIRKGFVGSTLMPINPKAEKLYCRASNCFQRGRDIFSVLLQGLPEALAAIFLALEKLLPNYAGKYATGDEIYLADLYLAPQIDNAINRYKLDMTEFPLLSRLNKSYSEVPSFQAETQKPNTD